MADGHLDIGVLVSANLITIALLFLLYFCYLHLQDYIYCLLYGFLFAEALWPLKLKAKAALERRGLRVGDFVLSLLLLGFLGFFAIGVIVFLGLFAFVDVLNFVQDIQAYISASSASIPKEWVNAMHEWLELQGKQLQTYNGTAWYPLVNDTVSYVGKMSAEGKTLSHHAFVNKMWDADFRQHLMDRLNLVVQDIGNMEEVKQYAKTSFFTSATVFSTVFFQVFSLLSQALDGLSRAFFLVSVAQYLLSREKNLMRKFISDFTQSNVQTGLLEVEVQRILDSAFVYPAGLAIMHGTVTLILCLIFGIPYCFFATFILVLFTLVPMLGTVPTLVLIPFALATGLTQGTAFVMTHIFVLKTMENWEMQKVWGEMHTDPYLTALLVCLGYSSMGWQAIILGPLCIGPLTIAYRLFTEKDLHHRAPDWPSFKYILKDTRSRSRRQERDELDSMVSSEATLLTTHNTNGDESKEAEHASSGGGA